MKMGYFGDTYDVTKRFLLGAIAPDATEWVAFPMFTHKVTKDDIAAYEKFLRVSVTSRDALIPNDNRTKHLPPSHHRHIFLDPNTGIKIKPFNGARSVEYVFGPELVALCKQVHERLLLVFDQSIPNGLPNVKRAYIAKKLGYFSEKRISCFAYLSHTCFVVLSDSESTCQTARAHLLASHLPQSRLVN